MYVQTTYSYDWDVLVQLAKLASVIIVSQDVRWSKDTGKWVRLSARGAHT